MFINQPNSINFIDTWEACSSIIKKRRFFKLIVWEWKTFVSQIKSISLSIQSLCEIAYVDFDQAFVHAFWTIFSTKMINDWNNWSRDETNSTMLIHFLSSEWIERRFSYFVERSFCWIKINTYEKNVISRVLEYSIELVHLF